MKVKNLMIQKSKDLIQIAVEKIWNHILRKFMKVKSLMIVQKSKDLKMKSQRQVGPIIMKINK